LGFYSPLTAPRPLGAGADRPTDSDRAVTCTLDRARSDAGDDNMSMKELLTLSSVSAKPPVP
jgi:hypothetical protein